MPPRGRPPKAKQPTLSLEDQAPKELETTPRRRKMPSAKDPPATPSTRKGRRNRDLYTTPQKKNTPHATTASPATPSKGPRKGATPNPKTSASAASSSKGKKRVAEDPRYRTFKEASPCVNAILWSTDENERNRAERKLRRINTEIKKLGQDAININVLVAAGDDLQKAADAYIKTTDISLYSETESRFNHMLDKLHYPEDWRIDADKFTAFVTELNYATDAATRSVTDMSEDSTRSEDPYVEDSAEPGPSRRGTQANAQRSLSPGQLPDEYYESDPEGPGMPATSTTRKQSGSEDRHVSRFPGELSSEYYESDSAGDHAEEEVEASRRSYIPYADLRRETAKDWGISGGISKVLAWRPNGKVGCSVIAAYEENGVQTARVEAAGRRPFRKTKRTHIAYQCRGKKKRRDGKYWHEDHIIGIGLVAWRVEATYLKDPTAILRPTEKAWYPETYINILWNDNVWTWESRDNFRFIRGSRSYETDIYIYRVAIAQEGNYQEELTGVRPQYPDGGTMKNKHWRNLNAAGEAYWKQPRARRDRKIVNVDEERLTDLEEESVADANSVGESLEDFIDDAVEIPETEYAESVGEDGRPVYDEAISEEYDSQSAAEEESQQSNRIRHQYPRRRSRESVVAETVEHRRSSSRIGPQRHTSRAREDDLQDIPEPVHRGLSASRSAAQRQTSRRRELESQTQNISSSRHTAKDRRRHPLTPPRSRTETPRAVQQHHRSKQSRSRSAIPPLSPISEVAGSRSRGSQPRNHRGHGQPSSRQTPAPKRSQEEEYRRKASSMPRERDSGRIPSQRQSGKLRRSM